MIITKISLMVGVPLIFDPSQESVLVNDLTYLNLDHVNTGSKVIKRGLPTQCICNATLFYQVPGRHQTCHHVDFC